MTRKEAQELIDKYAEGKCTPQEKALIEQWYEQELSANELSPDSDNHLRAKKEMWESIREVNGLPRPGNRTRKILTGVGTVAAILIILSTAAHFYQSKKTVDQLEIAKEKINDIDPGVNKAVLTLANGRRILLDDTGQGLIATQAGIRIKKLSDGMISYELTNDIPAINSRGFNTIETPKGGKYQILLPDGSKVWLNAASSLHFPATFTNSERRVELNGEAFFEVAKNKLIPFRVITRDISVSVTGTQFNVMAYKDESFSATTLVEGSVDVNNKNQNMTLSPGEQVVNKAGVPLSKKMVDVDQATAWKNGLFQFADTDIETVMRQIGRWYDVTVEYKGKIPANRFGGYISRDSKLSQVLKMLELSGVKFALEEKKIIVLP